MSARVHVQSCELQRGSEAPADVSAAGPEATRGLYLLRRALHGSTANHTTPASVASASNLGYPLHELSHDTVAMYPYMYRLPNHSMDIQADIADDPREPLNFVQRDHTAGTVFRRSDDYTFRGDALRTVQYLARGQDPRVEWSPFMVHMWFRKEVIQNTTRKGVPFRPGHPQHSTHHLVLRPRRHIPYFARSVPPRPPPNGDRPSLEAYAEFALTIMRDHDILSRLYDENENAGLVTDWWAEMRGWLGSADPDGPPSAQYAADCRRLLDSIDARVKAASISSKPFRLRRLEMRAVESRGLGEMFEVRWCCGDGGLCDAAQRRRG